MVSIQFLTMVGCHNCAEAKKIFEDILPTFGNKVEVEEIDIASDRGQELVQKYGVMASPGIVINGELFSTGGVTRDTLVAKLQELTGA